MLEVKYRRKGPERLIWLGHLEHGSPASEITRRWRSNYRFRPPPLGPVLHDRLGRHAACLQHFLQDVQDVQAAMLPDYNRITRSRGARHGGAGAKEGAEGTRGAKWTALVNDDAEG